MSDHKDPFRHPSSPNRSEAIAHQGRDGGIN